MSDVDMTDIIPLHVASSLGDVAIINILVDYGCDPNSYDIFHRTPLMIAIMNNHLDAARSLLARGANPNLCDLFDYTSFHYVAIR